MQSPHAPRAWNSEQAPTRLNQSGFPTSPNRDNSPAVPYDRSPRVGILAANLKAFSALSATAILSARLRPRGRDYPASPLSRARRADAVPCTTLSAQSRPLLPPVTSLADGSKGALPVSSAQETGSASPAPCETPSGLTGDHFKFKHRAAGSCTQGAPATGPGTDSAGGLEYARPCPSRPVPPGGGEGGPSAGAGSRRMRMVCRDPAGEALGGGHFGGASLRPG